MKFHWKKVTFCSPPASVSSLSFDVNQKDASHDLVSLRAIVPCLTWGVDVLYPPRASLWDPLHMLCEQRRPTTEKAAAHVRPRKDDPRSLTLSEEKSSRRLLYVPIEEPCPVQGFVVGQNGSVWELSHFSQLPKRVMMSHRKKGSPTERSQGTLILRERGRGLTATVRCAGQVQRLGHMVERLAALSCPVQLRLVAGQPLPGDVVG